MEGGSSRVDASSSPLPYDVALTIVSYLEVSDVCALSTCSRFWRDLCASDSIWVALYKQRWPSADDDLVASPSQGSKAIYINKHKKMASAVSAVIEFVEEWSHSGSLEVCHYLKAVNDLGLMELGFKDFFNEDCRVVGFDRMAVDVMEVLESCQMSERQVCVSWYMPGRVLFFHMPEEHRSRTTSLSKLAMGKEEVLGVLNGDAIHEIPCLRITKVATGAA